jgi:serine phosphatase RsbU (regulator of sigma subunit)
MPFGVPFDNPVRTQPLELSSGDRLVLYSDGVTEARPDAGEPFGLANLVPALQEVRRAPAREAARRVIRQVRAHRAQELADDATVLVLDIP